MSINCPSPRGSAPYRRYVTTKSSGAWGSVGVILVVLILIIAFSLLTRSCAYY